MLCAVGPRQGVSQKAAGCRGRRGSRRHTRDRGRGEGSGARDGAGGDEQGGLDHRLGGLSEAARGAESKNKCEKKNEPPRTVLKRTERKQRQTGARCGRGNIDGDAHHGGQVPAAWTVQDAVGRGHRRGGRGSLCTRRALRPLGAFRVGGSPRQAGAALCPARRTRGQGGESWGARRTVRSGTVCFLLCTQTWAQAWARRVHVPPCSGTLTALSAAGVRRSAAGARDRCRRRMVRVCRMLLRAMQTCVQAPPAPRLRMRRCLMLALIHTRLSPPSPIRTPVCAYARTRTHAGSWNPCKALAMPVMWLVRSLLYACVCARASACSHVCVCVFAHARARAHTHTCSHTPTRTHTAGAPTHTCGVLCLVRASNARACASACVHVCRDVWVSSRTGCSSRDLLGIAVREEVRFD